MSIIIWGDQLKSLQSTLHLFLQGKGYREANIKSQSQVEINQVFDVGKVSFFLNPCIFPLPDCTDIMCLIQTQRRAGETAQLLKLRLTTKTLRVQLSAPMSKPVCSFPLLDMMACNPSIGGQRQVYFCKFEANLVYMASSRTARAI